jgi:hypothetical protein
MPSAPHKSDDAGICKILAIDVHDLRKRAAANVPCRYNIIAGSVTRGLLREVTSEGYVEGRNAPAR